MQGDPAEVHEPERRRAEDHRGHARKCGGAAAKAGQRHMVQRASDEFQRHDEALERAADFGVDGEGGGVAGRV